MVQFPPELILKNSLSPLAYHFSHWILNKICIVESQLYRGATLENCLTSGSYNRPAQEVQGNFCTAMIGSELFTKDVILLGRSNDTIAMFDKHRWRFMLARGYSYQLGLLRLVVDHCSDFSEVTWDMPPEGINLTVLPLGNIKENIPEISFDTLRLPNYSNTSQYSKMFRFSTFSGLLVFAVSALCMYLVSGLVLVLFNVADTAWWKACRWFPHKMALSSICRQIQKWNGHPHSEWAHVGTLNSHLTNPDECSSDPSTFNLYLLNKDKIPSVNLKIASNLTTSDEVYTFDSVDVLPG